MRVRHRARFLLLASALLGCARAPALTVRASPPAAAAQDKGNPIEVPETIPLVVEVGGRRFPVPLVHATVNGVETLLIVDTGSSHNVVTSSFAAAHAIAVGTTATTGTGHANETIDARPIASLSLSVGAVSRTLTDAVVVAAPPVFEQLGIGGFLSPQNFFLATTVLDFPRAMRSSSCRVIAAPSQRGSIGPTQANRDKPLPRDPERRRVKYSSKRPSTRSPRCWPNWIREEARRSSSSHTQESRTDRLAAAASR